MKHPLIFKATLADIPALEGLINGAYRGENAKKGWTTEADLVSGIRIDQEGLRTLLENPRAIILKYEEAGSLIGCVYLEKNHIDNVGSSLYLGMLTVSPEKQAGGIGKQLLQAAEYYARERGCDHISMTVITLRHELIAYYERHGFWSTGEVIPFPNDPRTGISHQPLEFIVLRKKLA